MILLIALRSGLDHGAVVHLQQSSELLHHHDQGVQHHKCGSQDIDPASGQDDTSALSHCSYANCMWVMDSLSMDLRSFLALSPSLSLSLSNNGSRHRDGSSSCCNTSGDPAAVGAVEEYIWCSVARPPPPLPPWLPPLTGPIMLPPPSLCGVGGGLFT